MAEIIEVANVAYEARDRAQAEISGLKGSAEKEQSTPRLPTAPAQPLGRAPPTRGPHRTSATPHTSPLTPSPLISHPLTPQPSTPCLLTPHLLTPPASPPTRLLAPRSRVRA